MYFIGGVIVDSDNCFFKFKVNLECIRRFYFYVNRKYKYDSYYKLIEYNIYYYKYIIY